MTVALEMTAKGYIDLDEVLLDFNAWEKEAAAFEKENAELKLKVKSLEKQCCLYEKAQAETQSVSTEYLAMIEKLQATLLRRCNMEVENEKLKKDLAEIKEKQKSLEKKHAKELKSALDDLEAAQEAHKMEIAILHDTLAEQSRHEVETLRQMLQNKNNENKELMKQIADSEREKQHELVKLRLEYDSKILQLQKQSSAVNLSGGGPSVNSDIFRKKLQHMRQDSNREISSLKQVISDLERKLAGYTKGRRRP